MLNIACLFYSETWYLILTKKINIFTTKLETLRKWSLAEKLEFLNHVGNNRKEQWKYLLGIRERVNMKGEVIISD